MPYIQGPAKLTESFPQKAEADPCRSLPTSTAPTSRRTPTPSGPCTPGGTQIYFVGDPPDRMVVVDSGEPYRSWTRQILAYHADLGRPKISAILITHGHGDHIGGLDRLQDSFDCEVRCHPDLEPRLAHQLGSGIVRPLQEQESVDTGGGVSLQAWHTPGTRGRPRFLSPASRRSGVQRRHHPR